MPWDYPSDYCCYGFKVPVPATAKAFPQEPSLWPELQTELMRNKKASKGSDSPKLQRWTGRNIYPAGEEGKVEPREPFTSLLIAVLDGKSSKGGWEGWSHEFCIPTATAQRSPRASPSVRHTVLTDYSQRAHFSSLLNCIYKELNYIWHFPLECSLHINCVQAVAESVQ